MVTKVYLIRHGETEGADAKRYKGHLDVPLSENGIRQMKQLSKYMYENGLTRSSSLNKPLNPPLPPFDKGGMGGFLSAVYSSDLGRAVKSAEIIAGPHGLSPIINTGLKERNFGIWEGMSFDEIKEQYPDEFKAWAGNPLKFCPMGGESTLDLKARALRAFIEIIASNNGKNIAIIAHGGINRIILCELLGMPLENIFRIDQDFGALNIIEIWDYPVLKLLNGRID